MSITEKLDLAIKLKETGTTSGAYTVLHNGKELKKEAYMTNSQWVDFLSKMTPGAKEEYKKGDGDELSEKNGRPPKMASYGSSSRMIYNLSHGCNGFSFEKQLPTTVGGKANLDGFCEKDNRYIFVEAKCHEIYAKQNVSVSKKYQKLYEYINERMPGELFIGMTENEHSNKINAEFFAYEEKLDYLDLKQMICHLLGIATGLLKGELKEKQIDFIYLLFDPTELEIEERAKGKIDEIYQRTCYECNLVDFATLFRVILEFLIANYFENSPLAEGIDDIICKFVFSLASQDYYPVLIQ